MIEPNMSITICFGLLLLSMLFISGIKIKSLILIIIPLLILLPLLIILEPYRFKRLMAFINPWASPKNEGYQLIQSLYALGSGGLFGVGIFNSRQKYRFLPFSESDFILSIIGEELGFVGIVVLFICLFFLFYRGVRVAVKCKEYFGTLLAFGIRAVFIIQVFINALVVSGSIPPTGLPLPLISCGNTSLIVFMSGFGILYNVSKDVKKY
ncbi:MAG: FtsW/RodA/SpoVE family cell cycle protein, partial [Clostridia bacterium]|nr:FtsW/RodA/SpoVE family cell cycle protein [Clostridia bacterium]